jgi:hypothetical protein
MWMGSGYGSGVVPVGNVATHLTAQLSNSVNIVHKTFKGYVDKT